MSAAGVDELYEQRYVRLVRLAFLLTGDNAVAQELVQDAFIALEQSKEPVLNPAGYLRQVVVNRCRSWARRRGVEQRALPLFVVRAGEPDQTDRLAVKAALDRLTDRQRAAVVLRYYDDCTEQQIAALLGCRPGTVKSLLSRGLAVMKEELGGN